jgi:hypothetical protein
VLEAPLRMARQMLSLDCVRGAQSCRLVWRQRGSGQEVLVGALMQLAAVDVANRLGRDRLQQLRRLSLRRLLMVVVLMMMLMMVVVVRVSMRMRMSMRVKMMEILLISLRVDRLVEMQDAGGPVIWLRGIRLLVSVCHEAADLFDDRQGGAVRVSVISWKGKHVVCLGGLSKMLLLLAAALLVNVETLRVVLVVMLLLLVLVRLLVWPLLMAAITIRRHLGTMHGLLMARPLIALSVIFLRRAESSVLLIVPGRDRLINGLLLHGGPLVIRGARRGVAGLGSRHRH